jgi:uncharacterized membrane protein
VLALALIVAFALALFLVGAVAYAYRRIGISESSLFLLLMLSLLGGLVNIPLARVKGRERVTVSEIVVFGMRYRVPVMEHTSDTIVAVNVGGALIPAGLSVYLLASDGVWWQAALAVVLVAAFVHRIARPVPGLGIAVPALAPPLLAAAAALLIAPSKAAAVAYVAGSLGTVIGADLLNLRKLGDLGASVASIGGAGTFDGVFLSGIVAVVLVAIA